MDEQIVQLTRHSPIIVVGKIIAFQPTGRIITTKDQRRYRVQLKRFGVAVENVLRGTVTSRELDIYCYQWAGDYIIKAKNIDYNTIDPGGRRVYFLTLENGRYRCFQDIYKSYIQVLSGRHRNLQLEGKETNEVIAELLLTPGEGINIEGFTNGYLPLTITFSIHSVGRMRTLLLVKPLLSYPNQLVRDRACVDLAAYFEGQDSCLDQLILRSDLTVPVRAEAEDRWRRRKDSERDLKYWFPKDPIQWLHRDAGSEDPVKMLDSLQVLTLHRNAEVRKMACAFMKQKFPESYKPSCGKLSDPAPTR